MKRTVSLLIITLCFFIAPAQSLRPGFDKEEYKALMKVSAQFGDSTYRSALPAPQGYKLIYHSPAMGLDNKWQLWMTDRSVPVISIRGTTRNAVSWLANFYAAMVPARGKLRLSENSTFSYQLAVNPKACVHTGWLVATAFLAQDLLPKIDSLYKAGRKEMLIVGHSQGGAIAYLLTAYLHNLQTQNLLSPALRFKTYCSAAPKPGNLYFAYEYEAATQNGWAYNVVNSADWVPETPVSIQTLNDFNGVNPFVNARDIIKKQSFFKRLALNYAYGKLKNKPVKAADKYRKYLGKYVAKSIKKALPGFEEPVYAKTQDYVRTGNAVTLLADDEYYKRFPQNTPNVFINHLHGAYLYLLDKLSANGEKQPTITAALSGTWELDSISGNAAMESLYPNKRPVLTVDEATKRLSGNTGCNSFSGTAVIDGAAIRFPEALMMTKMACAGDGETQFLKALNGANRYAVNGNTLTLIAGDVAVMRFVRK